MKNNNKIVILIPAYNPTEDLIPVSNELLNEGFTVVVVNDGSKEETKYIFEKLSKDITLLTHPQNMGKGQALKTGITYIKDNINCAGVITADADGQHISKDIINVANELRKHENTLVLGSRLDTTNMPTRSKFGNGLTRTIFHIATGKKVFDTQTGLRGIPSEFFEEFVKIDGSRYEYEINMLIYCTQNNIKIKEINISTIYIDNNKSSSFKMFRDSYKIYKCIFAKTRFFTGILYVLFSLLSFLLDLGIVLVLDNILTNLLNVHIALLVSVITARVISSLFNYLTTKLVVFKSNVSYVKSMIKFTTLVIATLITNYLTLDLLTNILGWNLTLSKMIVDFVLFVLNFHIQKKYIFKRK